MTDEIKEYIDYAVEKMVCELGKRGALRDTKDMMYSEVSLMLIDYYRHGENNPKMQAALDSVQQDEYFEVIPMYYGGGFNIREIAAAKNVDDSTIVRNKKRLCLDIYIALTE